MSAAPAIAVEGLARRFGDFEAVRGLDFEVARGELFAFLGPNGAGKTTTVRVLTTLLAPSAGRAAIDGLDVAREPRAVRRRIGVVFQEPSLDHKLTAEENLAFHAQLYHVPARERAGRVSAALAFVGLEAKAREPVQRFSGGMRRRLEIARGLLHDPAVLFLDEPTVGLDPQTRRAMWDHLVELKSARGATIFVTTHYMDEAERCDRVAIIDDGRLIALDTPDALRRRIGGEVVVVRAEGAAPEVDGVAARRVDGDLHFEVADGEAFIPRLVAALGERARSVSLRRPTLEDVFVKLTGKAIRDEAASGRELMGMAARRMGGRR
jgi:ABC-2 type transport system ATP-binding protein